jgi:hypothetical protein
MTAHVPRHHLERLGKRNPDLLADAAARMHVADCDHCAVRKRAFDAASQRYLEGQPPAEFARAVLARCEAAGSAASARTPRVVWWLGLAVALAAAAAALVVVLPRFAPWGRRPAIQLEGKVAFEVYARSGGRFFQVEDGIRLATGAELEFAYGVANAAHLLLLGIDASGVITRYHPPPGRPSTPLLPAERARLPMAVELDQRSGEQGIIALFSAQPLDEAEVRELLAEAYERTRASGAGISHLPRLELPAQQVSVWFRKP